MQQLPDTGSPQLRPASSQVAPLPVGQNQSLPATHNDAKSRGRLYIAEFSLGTVLEYDVPDSNNKGWHCLDKITNGGVSGIAVDANHIVYASYNDNSTHAVATFGPDCGARGSTLVDPNGDAGSVAVDSKRNTVYVGNANTGNIEVYKHGSTSPTGELDKYHGNGFGVAVDRAGDVFSSGLPIIEFPRGRNNHAKQLALSGLYGPVGISFDRDDNLLVTNEYNISIYAPPYNGAPKQIIPTQPFCIYSALDAKNKHLYVSEQTNWAVDVYTYPSGTYEYSISTGLQRYSVGAVALDPASKS